MCRTVIQLVLHAPTFLQLVELWEYAGGRCGVEKLTHIVKAMLRLCRTPTPFVTEGRRRQAMGKPTMHIVVWL